jgi:hypothetical protein
MQKTSSSRQQKSIPISIRALVAEVAGISIKFNAATLLNKMFSIKPLWHSRHKTTIYLPLGAVEGRKELCLVVIPLNVVSVITLWRGRKIL